MIAFFKHIKFWLPFLIILLLAGILELFLRSGAYDAFIKPKSRLGASFGRISDLKKIGFHRINWITVGDSKTDWGIDHGAIKDHQDKKGKTHIRMSLPGSNFMSIQSGIQWSIDNLPQLDGILLGLYEAELLSLSHPGKEFKTSWPYRNYLDHEKFNYFRTFKNNGLFSNFQHFLATNVTLNSLAITTYFSDIKNFLTNPNSRIQEVKNRNERWESHVNFKKDDAIGDLCAFQLGNLNECIASTKKFKSLDEVPKPFKTPYKNCSRSSALKRLEKKQWLTVPVNLEPFKAQWEYVFTQILESNKQLTLVFLPENEFYGYMSKPSNASGLADTLIEKYQHHPQVYVLDLRDVFKGKNHCRYYYDTVHFNQKGIDIITKRVLEALDVSK